ncbi:MAG: hypothetical protein LBS49_05450 [Candidatus Accumulibacter sp.]|jgi:hypothetical protein|nr:hypothetical protein [Accumulibacter sp.]
MPVANFLLVALFWPIHAMSGGNVSVSSAIPGVQLWRVGTFTYRKELACEYISDIAEGVRDLDEFYRYCDGTRSVYLDSFDSPITCKSEPEGDYAYFICLKTSDKRLLSVAPRLVIVSKKPLLPRLMPLPLTKEESERLRKAEKASLGAFANEDKHDVVRYKISSPNGFIYISDVSSSLEKFSAVFREINGKLQNIRNFGLIEGFWDLDADGMPEALENICGDEGCEDQFWSLIPKLHIVVSRAEY